MRSSCRCGLVLLTLVLFVLGCGGPALLEVSPSTIDFGLVELGQEGTEGFSVTNSGGVPVEPSVEIAAALPFSFDLREEGVIEPGDSRVLFVHAVPVAEGTVEGQAALRWGSGEGQRAELLLRVTGYLTGTDADGDGWTLPEDCDDGDPEVHPGAEEVCDGVDNNCSGTVDDTTDQDGDGFFDCDDCDDGDVEVNPEADEVCDGIDNDCDGTVDGDFDLDGDGYLLCGDDADCNDSNPTIHPGAPEVCNGLDDDCDESIDEDFLGVGDDVDQDGEPGCTDCDDTEPSSFHGNEEVCDELDNDCNGDVDENAVDLDGDGSFSCDDCDDSNGAVNPSVPEVCDGIDNDCSGAADEIFDLDADGETTCVGDCNDQDPAINSSAVEVCDGVDQDCDTIIDNGFDLDSDGVTTCGLDGLEGTADDDCDDTDGNNFPGNAEACDGLDNDCDGVAESSADEDEDGLTVCAGDCDDSDPANYPGNLEVCDGQDNNCDGSADEGYLDADADGYAGCVDCDDSDGANYPGNPEVCDGQDNDCSGVADDTVDLDGDGAYDCEDCDDSDPEIHPGALEICSGSDADCDGVAPEPCLSCRDALLADPSRLDGSYTVDSDASGPLPPMLVWCDMSTDGGGWTRILRTDTDVATNLAMMTTYAELYSNSAPDPAGGGLRRVAAQHWEDLALLGDLMVRHELLKVDGSSCDPLYYALYGGAMSVEDPAVGSELTYSWSGLNLHHVVNGLSPAELSTTDSGLNQNCVTGNGRVPWFYKAGCGNNAPTIIYYGPGANQPAVREVVLGWDINLNDQNGACGGDMIAVPPFAPPGPGWLAEVSQEYYVR